MGALHAVSGCLGSGLQVGQLRWLTEYVLHGILPAEAQDPGKLPVQVRGLIDGAAAAAHSRHRHVLGHATCLAMGAAGGEKLFDAAC